MGCTQVSSRVACTSALNRIYGACLFCVVVNADDEFVNVIFVVNLFQSLHDQNAIFLDKAKRYGLSFGGMFEKVNVLGFHEVGLFQVPIVEDVSGHDPIKFTTFEQPDHLRITNHRKWYR